MLLIVLVWWGLFGSSHHHYNGFPPGTAVTMGGEYGMFTIWAWVVLALLAREGNPWRACLERPEITTPDEDKHSFNWGWVAWPLVVLSLYVLSLGPVVMVIKSRTKPLSPRTVKFLESLYAPVIWAARDSFLSRPLDTYFDWWDAKGRDNNRASHH